MKIALTIITLLSTATTTLAQSDVKPIANAGTPGQRGTVNICTYSRNRLLTPPLYVVYSKDRIVFRSDTVKSKTDPSILGRIDQHAIKSMDILKDSVATRRFGDAGKWGVVEIWLNDVTHPDAYKMFQKNGN